MLAAGLLAAGVYRISSTRKNREIVPTVEPKTKSMPSAQLPPPIPTPSPIPMDASKTPNPTSMVDLITAVRSGTINDVTRALSRTKEVNATDEQGATALHYAAHRGACGAQARTKAPNGDLGFSWYRAELWKFVVEIADAAVLAWLAISSHTAQMS